LPGAARVTGEEKAWTHKITLSKSLCATTPEGPDREDKNANKGRKKGTTDVTKWYDGVGKKKKPPSKKGETKYG